MSDLSLPSHMETASRASTLAGALDTGFGLLPYEAATTLQSIAANPDLRDRLALIDPDSDWRSFRPLYEEAKRRRGKPEAEAGTNIHAAVEALVNGRSIEGVSEATRRDAEAVLNALRSLCLTPVATEEFVVTFGLPELVAGTRDLLCHLEGTVATHTVVDIKSTSSLGSAKFKGVSWAIQTAIYAHGRPYAGGEPDRDRWGRPRIDMSLIGHEERQIEDTRAYVVEVERGTGRVEVHGIDIERGWEWARLACEVRAARKETAVLW